VGSKNILVEPSNWRLENPQGLRRPDADIWQAGLPETEMEALMIAVPNAPIAPNRRDLERREGVHDQLVKNSLSSMPEECAEVLEMIHGQGMSLRQVAAYTGLSKSTVARRRDQARNFLATAIGWELPEREIINPRLSND
jgi:DNA-directed RNA polymerase specialized sigma24 family protein